MTAERTKLQTLQEKIQKDVLSYGSRMIILQNVCEEERSNSCSKDVSLATMKHHLRTEAEGFVNERTNIALDRPASPIRGKSPFIGLTFF